jgi:hypothetical protein
VGWGLYRFSKTHTKAYALGRFEPETSAFVRIETALTLNCLSNGTCTHEVEGLNLLSKCWDLYRDTGSNLEGFLLFKSMRNRQVLLFFFFSKESLV